eukprot:CAMPEP_0172947270 /NCGR_PEP_ID=MMETSP1075-20121228/227484_1 /TAXON_ID=2916 /ORGANISM="Ceratium fusus, Strain PA161109" /LENGTH=125 /DNA_ID=CAMNT_0013808737 /DNA_START=552 /DNA_END=929 /DNA_ORIENTATION=-
MQSPIPKEWTSSTSQHPAAPNGRRRWSFNSVQREHRISSLRRVSSVWALMGALLRRVVSSSKDRDDTIKSGLNLCRLKRAALGTRLRSCAQLTEGMLFLTCAQEAACQALQTRVALNTMLTELKL